MIINPIPAGAAKAIADMQTPEALRDALRIWHFATSCRFPLRKVPQRSYKDSGSGFGAPRTNIGPNILHPACDLEAPVGTEVLAVDDGVIIAGPYEFYLNTACIDVQHKFFIARYGEMKHGFRPKSRHVKRGDVLGHVGKVGKGNMLHFELFAGTIGGPLSQKGNPPWNRRKDLMDPTPFLDLWAQTIQ